MHDSQGGDIAGYQKLELPARLRETDMEEER